MRSFLSRHLPRPVKRVLSPVYYWMRRRTQRMGAFARSKRRQHRETWAKFNRGVRLTLRARADGRDLRRGARRSASDDEGAEMPVSEVARAIEGASRRRRRDAVSRRPRRLEAEARRLRTEVARLKRALHQAAADATDPHQEWYRQRVALTGGLQRRDFAYFPGGVQNPYLRLLYAGLPEVGFEARPLARFELLDRVAGDGVFHLHWTRVFQVGAGSEAEARLQSEAYLRRIEDFVGRGGTLVWSVHEALPHDCEYPEVERELRGRLGELASVVHVLHASTPGEVEGLYRLDGSKVVVVEHPLYGGVYDDFVSRGAARALLGVGDDEVLLVGFGAIRPYKGFDRLVRALPGLGERTGLGVRAIIAGPTFKSIDLSDLQALVDATDGASMIDGAVPDEYVQVLFRAADVVVLPYRQVLNSGVLMLALTFGCPAVAPENPVTLDAVGSGLVHLFDRESDEDLMRAVIEAIHRRHQRDGLPDAYLERFGQAGVARRFAEEMNARLGKPRAS